MTRAFVVTACALLCFAITGTQALSQASKQLDGRAKGVATPQEKSWQQVDEINNETDRTKARYHQAQQSGSQASQKSGYTAKKANVDSRSAYKKPSPPKTKISKNKK